MLYRCLTCGREEARGCLPTATCGLYLMALLALAGGLLWAALALTKWAIGSVQRPDPAPDPPWWLWPVALATWLGLLAGTTAGVNWLVQAAERLVVRRRPCQGCGGRRWSRGFTRGFGL
jgi:hypothetical protein